MTDRPASVELAAWLLRVQVLAGLVVSVLVVVYRDDLAEVWSPDGSGDSSVQPLDFVPVILVLYGVIAITTLTLIPLLRYGHNWARHSLAGIVLGILVSTLAIVRTMPPALFRGWTIVAAVLSAVTLVFLWHPDTRRHCLVDDEDGAAAPAEPADDADADAAGDGPGAEEEPGAADHGPDDADGAATNGPSSRGTAD